MLWSEHVYCVTIPFKMSDQSNESASDLAVSLNIPQQKLFGRFRRMQPWETGDWQFHRDNVPAHAQSLVQSFYGKTANHPGDSTANHPGDSAPLWPRFGALWLLAFPKTKITFQREKISDQREEIQENTTGQLMVIGRTIWGLKVPALKGTEVSLSCVQFILYLQ